MKNILWIFLLFISFISSTNAQVLDSTYSNSIELNRQNTSIIISKGDLIKINDETRQYFFHGYDADKQILRVKDVKQKFYFTQHKKINFKLDEIDKILIRTDDYNKKAAWMWYPTTLFLVVRKAPGYCLATLPLAFLPQKQFGSVMQGVVSVVTFDCMYQAWPLAKKIGRGNWLTIDLNSDQSWEVQTSH